MGAVLVRPDGFVAWRSPNRGSHPQQQLKQTLGSILGRMWEEDRLTNDPVSISEAQESTSYLIERQCAAGHREQNRESLGCMNPTLSLSHPNLSTNNPQKGLSPAQKVCYTALSSEPLANELLIKLPTMPRERWGGKRVFRD